MIGYLLLQALENALPAQQIVGLITQTLVRADDPAFDNPTKFVGPIYAEDEAQKLAARWGGRFAPMALVGGGWWPPPSHKESLTWRPSKHSWPTAPSSSVPGAEGSRSAERTMASSGASKRSSTRTRRPPVLAESLGADALLLLTDVPAVQLDYGTPNAHPIDRMSAAEIECLPFPSGSMGPKVAAACRFVRDTHKAAAIGSPGWLRIQSFICS